MYLRITRKIQFFFFFEKKKRISKWQKYAEEKAKNDNAYMHETNDIAYLFAQIILSMEKIHSNSILHRDLKSQNIFLTKNKDIIKIGDFGISKILASKSKALTVVGTPSYISPELCEGIPK